jgi:hypothetical protein
MSRDNLLWGEERIANVTKSWQGQLLLNLAAKHKLIKANVRGAYPKKGCETAGFDLNVYIPHLLELPAIGGMLIDYAAKLLSDSIGSLIAFYAPYERNYFILVLCHWLLVLIVLGTIVLQLAR